MKTMETMEPLEILARRGDLQAMAYLAEAYVKCLDGIEFNPERAVYWLKKLVEKVENPNAYFNLGLYYSCGFGTEKDLEKAMLYMQKAALLGDQDAPVTVKEYREAIKYDQAAKQGDTKAMAELAYFYNKQARNLDEHNCEKDYEESYQWAMKALENKEPLAYYVLGLYYEHIRNPHYDFKEALKWHKQGMEAGSLQSQYNYGCMLINGQGTEKRIREGCDIVRDAAEKGYSLAVDAVNERKRLAEEKKKAYNNSSFSLWETDKEGRQERIKKLYKGQKLEVKMVNDKYGKCFELFSEQGSVGVIRRHNCEAACTLIEEGFLEMPSAMVSLSLENYLYNDKVDVELAFDSEGKKHQEEIHTIVDPYETQEEKLKEEEQHKLKEKEKELRDVKFRIEAKEIELANCGFFGFSKKNALKETIKNLQTEYEQLDEAYKLLEEKISMDEKKRREEISRKVALKRLEYYRSTCDNPYDPDFKRQMIMCDLLMPEGKAMTYSDFQSADERLGRETTAKLSYAMRVLSWLGIVYWDPIKGSDGRIKARLWRIGYR